MCCVILVMKNNERALPGIALRNITGLVNNRRNVLKKNWSWVESIVDQMCPYIKIKYGKIDVGSANVID